MLRKITANAAIFTILSGHLFASSGSSNNNFMEGECKRTGVTVPSGPAEMPHAVVMRTIGQSIGPILAQIQKSTDPEERKSLEKSLAEAVQLQNSNIQLLGRMVSNPGAAVPSKTTLDKYLASTSKARLIIGCGHDHEMAKKRTVPVASSVISATEFKIKDQTYGVSARHRHKMDLSMAFDYHAHKGWFTIDSDEISSPDCSASLADVDVLHRLLPADTFQLVVEELSEGGLYTRGLFSAIARTLSKGGKLIANLPFLAGSTDGKSKNYIQLDTEWAGDLWQAVFPEALQENLEKESDEILAQLHKTKLQLQAVRGQKRLVQTKKQHLNALIYDLEMDLIKLKSRVRKQKLSSRFESISKIEEKLLPVFQTLGFTKISVHRSFTLIFLQLKGAGAIDMAPDNSYVRIGNTMTTIGALKSKGPHPEASAIDPYFKDKPLSMYYLIAIK